MKDNKIMKANKKMRNQSIIFIFIVVIISIIISSFLRNYLSEIETLAREFPEQAAIKIVHAIKIISILLIILFSLAGIYFLRLSILVFRTGMFPPAGIKTTKDISLITGKSARVRAIIILIFSFLFFAAVVFIPLYFTKIINAVL
ncbi:MAG: hypothetical protein K8R49_09135 [Candidatus Cloacimonetes bacterium]|nr:hypothetical protein [Candidatus Cloacimonadota bacterium]